MKTIIVPIDFSQESLNGLHMALLFAKRSPMNIQMVYVQKDSKDYRPGSFEEEYRYAEKNFEEILKAYSEKTGPVSRLRYIIKKGKIYKEIIEQAESYKDSFICASTYGASGFEEFFIGSNAYKIVTGTQTQVVTLRKKAPERISKIVVPLRLHVDTRQKVPVAADLADLFKAEVHLLAATTVRNKKDSSRLSSYLTQSENYLKGKGLKPVVKSVVGENRVELVKNYCHAVDASMVTIMTSQRGSMSLLTGSFAHSMVSQSDIPVVNITAREKHIPAGFATRGHR